MSSPAKFHVREADSAAHDGEFIIAAFDSALPYLASIGSHEQWGLTPFSERKGWAAETMQQIQDAETYRLTGQGDARHIFIVDAEVPAQLDGGDKGEKPGVGFQKLADGRHEQHFRIISGQPKSVLPVGFAFVREDHIPGYILRQQHITIRNTEQASSAYIEVMVADQRVGRAIRKGSGAALIQGIHEFGRKATKKSLFIDGWAGNDKKLIEFVPLPLSPSRFLKFTVWFLRRILTRT